MPDASCALAAAVEVERHEDLGLLGVALDFGLTHGGGRRRTARGERLDQFRVLVGGADREPQAVGEQWMRAVQVADQYTTLPSAPRRRAARRERARARSSPPRENGARRGIASRAASSRARSATIARALPLEHVAMREQQLGRGRGEHVHVVRRAQLLQLRDPFAARRRRARAAGRRGPAWTPCAPAAGWDAGPPRPSAWRRPRTGSRPRRPPPARATPAPPRGSPRAGTGCRWDCSDRRAR